MGKDRKENMAYTDSMKEERSTFMWRIANEIKHDDAWPIYQQGSIDADRLRNEDLEIAAFCKIIYDYGYINGIENEFTVGIPGVVLFREMCRLIDGFPEWDDFYTKAYQFLTEDDGYEKVVRLSEIYTAKKDFIKGIASALSADDDANYLLMSYSLEKNEEYITIVKEKGWAKINVTGNSNQSNYMEIYREIYGDGAIGKVE